MGVLLLGATLEGVLEIRDERVSMGRPYFEASLVSEDGQTLHLYEGQLKEVKEWPVVGRRYRVAFTPFVNNRWIELKITALTPEAAP